MLSAARRSSPIGQQPVLRSRSGNQWKNPIEHPKLSGNTQSVTAQHNQQMAPDTVHRSGQFGGPSPPPPLVRISSNCKPPGCVAAMPGTAKARTPARPSHESPPTARANHHRPAHHTPKAPRKPLTTGHEWRTTACSPVLSAAIRNRPGTQPWPAARPHARTGPEPLQTTPQLPSRRGIHHPQWPY